MAAAGAQLFADTVLEAEKYADKAAVVFRDERASGEKVAGVFLNTPKSLLTARVDLPAGDYVATFWMEAVPAEILHHLAVTLRIDDSSITLGQIFFDSSPGYRPFPMAFSHPGGTAVIQVKAAGGSGFDGMRKGMSEREQKAAAKAPEEMDDMVKRPGAAEDSLDILEGGRNVKQLSLFDHRLLCDRIEVRTIRTSPVMVTGVEVDKIHYLPGETVKAEAVVQAGAESGEYTFVGEDVTELDSAREVFRKAVTPGKERQGVSFEYNLNDREFGHALRCSLFKGSTLVHSRSQYFGVSRNVYRIGITGNGMEQNMQGVTAEDAARYMLANKKTYANYFERFAWAPCDYSDLAPSTEFFWSGQVQYPGSITGFKHLLNEAHKVGVKGITYGKACAGGIAGFNTFQKHPELFRHGTTGPGCEAMNVFFLERMLANDYSLSSPAEGGWAHWASLWSDWSRDDTVEFGAQAIMNSIEMFGWDGVRWDGHFVGRQQPFLKMLRAKYPNFVHGYNIAFARPGSALFLPPDTNDFPVVSADHGMLMDESVREWSHSNFSPGFIEPFYTAICREADYEKRIGGLPLFITFDMASPQDTTLNVLFGLAAGERYTYLTSPGDFPFGPLPKFLTRYSAFVWDDTKRVAKPESVVSVTVDGKPSSAPWWKESVWLRDMPGNRQQVLVHMVNPPGYSNFASRVQTTPVTLTNMTVRLIAPAGATLIRAFHLSPDLVEGHVLLDAVKDGDSYAVVIPRMRTWSIVGYEIGGGLKPAFTLTTPVEDAQAVLAKQAEEEAKKIAEQKAKTGTGPTSAASNPILPYYQDYAKSLNADLEFELKMAKPRDLDIARNGVLDVHHARGAYSWLNPVESAAALADAANFQPSWVNFVVYGINERPGCMDEFPDTYEQLMAWDVLVLDNLHARHLGPKRRVMVADFVRNGGGLLVFGGYWNLSLGADHNTYIEEILPVRIAGYKQIVQENKGLALKVEKAGFFDKVDWSSPMQAFTVDLSPLKEGAEVLATAGGKPAIVARPYGRGRVIAVLMNPHGDYGPDAKPYWLSPQWPRILASCIKNLGQGSEVKAEQSQKKRQIDPTKIKPHDLAVEAFNLRSKEFTAKLKEAKVNMVDADSARVLLETAFDNIDKVADMEILTQIAEEARPYFDKSMAGLGEKLSKSDLAFIRQAGFRMLGLAGDPKYRDILEDALRDKSDFIVREALIGLGRIGDPASLGPVKQYQRSGSQKLLALTVQIRLGERGALKDALPAYEQGLARRIKLKCGRFALIHTLFGGVSFKLTPEARKKAMDEYHKQLKMEEDAKFDVFYFNETIRDPTDEDLNAIAEFLAGTKQRDVVSMAYAVFNRLPPEKAKPLKARLANARIEELRLLAGS